MRTSPRWTALALQTLLLVSVYELVGRVVARLDLPLRDAALVAVERVITLGRVPLIPPAALPSWCLDAFSAAYLSYFALPIVLIVGLARTTRVAAVSDATSDAVKALLVAFYMHYAMYAIVPAVGPARTADLPASIRIAIAEEGGVLTHTVRRAIGTLEGPAPDAFPSAHASIALLVAAFARRHRLAVRWIIYPLSAAIVASTVILGYHYVVDVIASVPVARLAWLAGRRAGARSEGAPTFAKATVRPP